MPSSLLPARARIHLASRIAAALALLPVAPSAMASASGVDGAAVMLASAALSFGLVIGGALGLWLGLRRRRGAAAGLDADGHRRASRERRALEQAFKRRVEMIESVREAVFRTDGAGRLRFLNRAWSELSGFSVEQTAGRPLADFLHPDERERANAMLHALLHAASGDTDVERSAEFRLRTRAGEVRWVELTGRAVGTPGGTDHGIVGTLDDISARKVAELSLRNLNAELETRVQLRTAALEASNRELEAFSYSVSHDLRAPLRAIDGFARILAEDCGPQLDEAGREHLQRIRKATERMAVLIDALIDLASLTRKPLHRESVDLSAIARGIVDELQAAEPQRKVKVEITSGLIVNADRALMSVLLGNLLRNAWKFTARQHDASILFHAEHDGEQRVFHVSDNGAGFDMEFADQMFRPFHRLHRDSEFPGNGIGLATVKRIVERHHGRVWAQAQVQQGARFSFTLGG